MLFKAIRKVTKIILILCNLIVSLSFLLSCYGSSLDQDKYWFTNVLNLGALYFFLILLAFFLFWLFVKPLWSVISIVTVALAWQPLHELTGFHLPHSFKIEKDGSFIRVMSWNVEHFDILEHQTHPEVKKKMIEMINRYSPDVTCFQEMVASDSFSSAINYLPKIMKELNMTYYHYSFNRKLDFDNKHHFGEIIFSKFPIINKQTVSHPPYDYNSIFQYADILKGRDTFRIFNVHLQSLKFNDENRQYIEDPGITDEKDIRESKSVLAKLKAGSALRKIQSDRIRATIDKSPLPVIVCGDFNDVPNSYAYKIIGAGLKNAFSEKGFGIGRTFYSISPTLRIDNIFVHPSFEVQQFVRVKKKLSDHFPIIADLYFNNQ